jgi:uncharacterized cupredoxin-like copper-binding protein
MRIYVLNVLIAATACAALVAGCGPDPDDRPNAVPTFADGNPVIDVAMIDLAFQPATVTVAVGQTVHLWFHNDGTVIHDAIIGDTVVQDDQAAAMTAGGVPLHGPGAPETLILKPGESGSLTYTATGSGTLIIGCHQPGHWEAGMKAILTIT